MAFSRGLPGEWHLGSFGSLIGWGGARRQFGLSLRGQTQLTKAISWGLEAGEKIPGTEELILKLGDY